MKILIGIFLSLLLCSTAYSTTPIEISTVGTKLGIGTTSTANTLSIGGNMAIGSSYTSNTAPTNGLIVQGSLGIGTFSTSAINSNYLGGLYGSSNGARTFFVYNPNVGTGAQARFELKSADTNGELIQFPENGATAVWAGRTLLYSETGDGIAISAHTGTVDLQISTTTKLRVASGGNIGIGTLVPQKLFCVGSTCQGSVDSSGNIIGVGFTSSGNVGVSTTAPTTCGCKQFTNGLCTTVGTCT